MQENADFPKGFLWGSATAAYQVEGGIENNDWAQAARDGMVPPTGRACGHYELYEQDFDLAKSLGQNAHRFSIEWARIEPEEGKFDDSEMEHYRKVISALRERGLEPFVTLWHFTLPLWFSKTGGFENPKSSFYFSRFCEYVVRNLEKGSVRFLMTLNEPMACASMGFLHGEWPPFKKWHRSFHLLHFLKMIKNMVTSHNVAYRKIKAVNPDFQIGVTAHCINFESNFNPIYPPLVKFLNWFWNHRFLKKIRRHQDFIGLNYYRHLKFGGKPSQEKSDMGWEIYPKGIFNLLKELSRYKKPIYVTENGIADSKDNKRTKFIVDHLHWVKHAIDDKIDVRGYFYWSLLDNYEWAHGFGPRFGLIQVDYNTLERRVRQSAYEYKKICGSNSLRP